MCPQSQKLACQCVAIFHDISFQTSRPNRNYQVLTACAFCFSFNKYGALFQVPQVNDRTEDIAPTAVAMVNMFGIVPNPAFARSSGTPRGTEEGPSSPGVIPVRDQSRAADGKAAVEDNPWDGYDAFRPDPPTRVKKRGDDEWICPQHGPMCNPGICKALARVERDERWRKEREEREEATRKRKEAREMRARRRGTKLTRADGRGVPRSDRPRRLANGPRRGASSSGSETEGDGGHDQGAILIERANEVNIYLTCSGLLTRFVAVPYGKFRPRSSSPAN
jgi:hypothetical protein